MNYRGTWICAGNYSRILLVGDIWVNTICPSVQRECKDPIDVVYSNEGAEMLYKLICQQMLHTHYGMIILCENAYDTVATATLTERLMGMFARSTIVLATAPPEWLKSIKYKGTETTKERNNTQCRKIAEQYQLPCLDFAEWAERDGLQTQESASYPARFLTKLELKRLHFNKIKKIKKIDAREGERQELTLRYMAIKMAMFINKIRQDKAKESVLWDNFQYTPCILKLTTRTSITSCLV